MGLVEVLVKPWKLMDVGTEDCNWWKFRNMLNQVIFTSDFFSL